MGSIDSPVTRLRQDGSFEATTFSQLKKGDVFVWLEGSNSDKPVAWVAIRDWEPPGTDGLGGGLRLEQLRHLGGHIVDGIPGEWYTLPEKNG